MSTVQSILDSKGHGCLTIQAGATVSKAIKLMVERNIGSLVVVDGEDIVGLFSERDFLHVSSEKGKCIQQFLIQDVMHKKPIVVKPETSSTECMALMTDKRVRHLPVTNNGKLVGVVSIGDIVKQIINEKVNEINQLNDYIMGNRHATH